MPYKKRKYTKGLNKTEKRQVQQLITRNSETKSLTHSLNGQAVDNTTGYAMPIADIPVGNDEASRIGSEVELRRFVFDGAVTFPDSTNIVRVVVMTVPDNVYSPLNYIPAVFTPEVADKNGYKIWRDFLVTGGSSGPSTKKIKLNVPFFRKGRKGMKLHYYGNSATQHVMGNPGRPYIWFISDSVAASHPAITGHGKTFFKDP